MAMKTPIKRFYLMSVLYEDPAADEGVIGHFAGLYTANSEDEAIKMAQKNCANSDHIFLAANATDASTTIMDIVRAAKAEGVI